MALECIILYRTVIAFNAPIKMGATSYLVWSDNTTAAAADWFILPLVAHSCSPNHDHNLLSSKCFCSELDMIVLWGVIESNVLYCSSV